MSPATNRKLIAHAGRSARTPGSAPRWLLILAGLIHGNPGWTDRTSPAACLPIFPTNAITRIGFDAQDVICDLGAGLKIFNTISRTWTLLYGADRDKTLAERPGLRWNVLLSAGVSDGPSLERRMRFRAAGHQVLPHVDYASADRDPDPLWVFGNTGYRSYRHAFVDIRRHRGYTVTSQLEARFTAINRNHGWIAGRGYLGEADLDTGQLIVHRTVPDLDSIIGAVKSRSGMFLLDAVDGLLATDTRTGIVSSVSFKTMGSGRRDEPLGLAAGAAGIILLARQPQTRRLRLDIRDDISGSWRVIPIDLGFANRLVWHDGKLYGYGSENPHFEDYSPSLEYWSNGGMFEYDPATGKARVLIREAVTGVSMDPFMARSLGPEWQQHYWGWSGERSRMIRILDTGSVKDASSRFPRFTTMDDLEAVDTPNEAKRVRALTDRLCVIPRTSSSEWERLEIIQK